MDKEMLEEILERFENSKLTKFHYETDDQTLILEQAPPQATSSSCQAAQPSTTPEEAPLAQTSIASAAPQKEKSCVELRAPLVGTFYISPEPGVKPYVKPGQEVKKGDTVGILEAMKMMNYLEAPCDGVVREILAENGELVGYNEPILRIEPHHV